MSDTLDRIGRLSPAKQKLLQEKLKQRASSQVPPIRPSRRHGASLRFPCSFSQRRLWFLHEIDPKSPAYNVPLALQLVGPVDVGSLTRALSEVVRRHEVLRSTFEEGDEGPVQVVAPAAAVPLPVLDLSGLAGEALAAEIEGRTTDEARRPFRLARGPVLRAALLRRGPEEHVLLVSLHHIVCDAWSNALLLSELATLYGAYKRGEPSPLPELPVQYADFAEWQRGWLQGEVLATQVEHWRWRLAGAPPLLALPTDRPRPAVQSLRGAGRSFVVPADLARRLEALSRQEGTTLFATLLTVFQMLLCRLSGQEDVCVGTPVAGRRHRETEGLIGFFVNTLVQRADLSGDPSFHQALVCNRDTLLDDQAHQDLPFEKLVDDLRIERTLAHTPLFQVMLAFQNTARPAAPLDGLAIVPAATSTQSAKLDLTLALAEDGAGLQGDLEYATDLFDAVTVERFLGHLAHLLTSAVDDPGRPLSALRLMDAAEERQMQVDLNRTERSWARSVTVHELFAQQADRTPDRIAAVGPWGSLTYREIAERSTALAFSIQTALPGLRLDRRIVLLADPGPRVLIGMLGILEAGCGFVPIDPRHPDELLAWTLEDCAGEVLVTEQRHLERATGLACARHILCLDDDPSPAGTAKAREHRGLREPRSLAYVVYTSGSTGKPTGVQVAHESLVPMLLWGCDHLGLGEHTRVLQSLSFCFDLGIFELLTTLLAGGTLRFPEEASGDPAAFAGEIVRHGINTLHTTPTFARELAAADETLDSLEILHLGGEALARDTVARLREAAPHASLFNGYGPTEATANSSIHRISETEDAGWPVVPIGRRSADNALYILDRMGQISPFGARGELHVGGIGVARGYLDQPDLTAERFVPDPFGAAPGGRLYRTGDLVRYLAGGDIEHCGRIDHQAKVRGFRIEPGEIEVALGEHPAVRQAAVLARDEEGGDRRLVAYLVTGAGRLPGAEELRAFLKRRLPEHMLPAAFVPLAALSLTAHGQIDRAALPAPPCERSSRAGGFIAPRTQEERALSDVWSQVLGVGQVGLGDNFFALGGDSILSIRARSLAAARGLRFELQDLFSHQTLGELARVVQRTGGEAAESLPPFALVAPEDRERLPSGLDDAYPLSLLQLGMLFHSESSGGSIPYHYVSRFTLRGALDPAALAGALERLAARHPVLRTSIDTMRLSEPLQLVHPAGGPVRIPLACDDLRALPAEVRERVREERFAAEREGRFDWSVPPLLRCWVALVSDDTSELGLTYHHAIVDGWSVSTLLSELFALYTAEVRGEPSPLPTSPDVAFRDFVALERQALASSESRRFWSERLAGHSFRELPRWPARPAAPAQRIATLAVPLSTATAAALGRRADAEGIPLKSLLLAAHLRVLELVNGDPDVTTGLVMNGRPEVEAGERGLGLFLNTVPLRLRLAEGSWRALVRAVLAAESELLPHRRFPLAELQRSCGGGRRLFEVSFNYVHFHVLRSTRELDVLDMRSFGETSFPLTVHCDRDALGADLRVLLQYDAGELHAAQVRTLAEIYARTLAALALDPERSWASELPLPEEQVHQILHEWSQTPSRPSPDLCAHQLFQAAAERSPGAVALICPGERISYRELDRRSGRLAHHLRRLGAGPGTRVGLRFERSPEMVEALLAVLKAGAAYVPLDPSHPAERLVYMMEDAGIELLLTRERLDADHEAIAAAPDGRLAEWAGPGDLAYVLYTSGSTGWPKGVMVSHRGLVNYLLWSIEAYRVADGTGAPVHSPLGFDLTVTSLLAPLAAGRTVTLLPGGEVEALAGTLRQAAGLSLVKITPAHLEVLGHLLAPEEHAGRAHALIIGGEALNAESLDAWRRHAPATRLINEYGPTETVVGCAIHEVTPEDTVTGRVPIGRAIANTRLYVVGPGLRLAPAGAPGELWIGGDGVACGYLNRPDLTAERFVPDPFGTEPGARLYRSGDQVRHLPDGRLDFLGRLDDQVKIRGFRIEPGEIEAALRSHPGALEAAVVARESSSGDRRLTAYLVAGAQAPTVPELREHLQRLLPAHMIPAAFVLLPALPLTPNGKVDRAALPEPAQETEREAAPPRDEVERQLVQLWEKLLDLRPVGIRDDFFALGGHSLLALRLVGDIERLFGRKLPLSTLLEVSTVERLGQLLRSGPDLPRRSLVVPIQPDGSGPPLFCVHPIGGNVFCYRQLADLACPVYGIQSPDPASLALPWTVETMAALYLDALREVQPAGPYLLAGWSMGGVVAFEMARQLETAGDEVALLALVDVGPPGRGPAPESPGVELFEFLDDVRGLAGLEPASSPPHLEAPATLDALLAREEVRAILPPDLDAARVRELFDTFSANHRALRAYRPGPYGGTLTLIRAEVTAAQSSANVVQAWRELAGEGVEVHSLPGDHYSLLRPPAAAQLSGLIDSLIQWASARMVA